MHALHYIRSDYITIPYINILLEHGFRVMVSSRYRHCRDFWDPPVFHHVWLGLLTVISYATSFRRVLQDADLQATSQLWWCSTTFSSCISGILEELVSATVDGTVRGWPTAWPAVSSDLNPLDILVTSNLYSLCYSSGWRPALATTNRMGHRWSVRQPEFFSKSSSHSPDVQHPASRLKVDAVNIFLIFRRP